MHFSIESRVPFLDHNLVEATLKSQSNCKIRNGETKYILREALKDILPEKVTQRKDKKGFESPKARWFRSIKVKNYMLEVLNSESFKKRKYFNQKASIQQYNQHVNEVKDHSKELWKLLNLELWFREFIDKKSV